MYSALNAGMLLVFFFGLVVFLAVPIVLPIGFVIVVRRRGRPRLSAILGILSVVSFVGYARMGYAVLPLGDKRVADFHSADGENFVVHQICNYSAEPYTTRFYYRLSPSQSWRAFYMDHEDTRWFSGRMKSSDDRTSGCRTVHPRRGRRPMTLTVVGAQMMKSKRHVLSITWLAVLLAGVPALASYLPEWFFDPQGSPSARTSL